MRSYLFASLLFVLSAAAPAADDHIKFPVLQKRDISCDVRYGQGILEQDCVEAMKQMQRMTPNAVHPGTGLPLPNMGGFGRLNPDARYRLPQRFSVGTCTILVDTIEPWLTLPSTWNILANNAKVVIDQCVHTHGTGGRFKAININTVIANEANIGPEIRDLWQYCMNTITMQQNQDGFIHCLLESLDRTPSEQAHLAGSRASHT